MKDLDLSRINYYYYILRKTFFVVVVQIKCVNCEMSSQCKKKKQRQLVVLVVNDLKMQNKYLFISISVYQ